MATAGIPDFAVQADTKHEEGQILVICHAAQVVSRKSHACSTTHARAKSAVVHECLSHKATKDATEIRMLSCKTTCEYS